MPCRSPCRLYIHLTFTYSIGLSSVVWSKLGLAPPFPPMRVLEVQWSWAFSLVCEVDLRDFEKILVVLHGIITWLIKYILIVADFLWWAPWRYGIHGSKRLLWWHPTKKRCMWLVCSMFTMKPYFVANILEMKYLHNSKVSFTFFFFLFCLQKRWVLNGYFCPPPNFS